MSNKRQNIMKSKRRIQAYYVKKFITIDWKKRAVVLDAADNALWDIRTNIFLGEVDDVNSQKKIIECSNYWCQYFAYKIFSETNDYADILSFYTRKYLGEYFFYKIFMGGEEAHFFAITREECWVIFPRDRVLAIKHQGDKVLAQVSASVKV